MYGVRDPMSLKGLLCLEPSQSIHEIQVGRQQYTFLDEDATCCGTTHYIRCSTVDSLF